MTTQRLLVSDIFCLSVSLYISIESSLYFYTGMHRNRNPMKGDEQHTKVPLCDIFINAEITERKNSFRTVSVLVSE